MKLSGLHARRLRTPAALFLAGLAALALYGYLRGIEERTAKHGPLQRIAVAAADIPMGKSLDAGAIAYRLIPGHYVLENMLKDDPQGRIALHDIREGDPLLESDLAVPGEEGSIALRLPRGTRGYPLPLQQTSLPAAAVKRGDRVDVLAVDGTESWTILEQVFLMDLVDASTPGAGLAGMSQTYGSSGYAVLQVTPDEAERLARAANEEGSSVVLVICPLAD